MPGKVKIKIIAGRNLPVMDRSSDTTDAYVEIKLGNTTYKTDVCRKSLNPQWNSEWYRFEVDDSELQDEPLQIRLMDHDTYSANDAIGKVYLNLNPLLIPAVALPGKYGWTGDTNVDPPTSSVMSGWIPVYDTMHGIRGEVNITVKVELFSDFNKFRQSSCGVQFFCSPVIPHGFHAQVIHGFIEELVVNDDPEYQWIDKIRTPRASNEARQTLFFKLSGELQRKIGVKALDLGGNAVIGYSQCFDLEGESGIVARGIGTVVTLIKHHEIQQQLDFGIAEEKALSYLKFLAFDNGLKLDNDNIFKSFSQSAPNPKTLSILAQRDQITGISPRRNIPVFLRQTSQPTIELETHVPLLKTCVSSRSLSDDIKGEIALRQMLQQEDMRGESSSNGLSRKIKYFKSSSQSKLSKKMFELKVKLSDSTMQESDHDRDSVTTKEETGSMPSSLIDLRELRKKKKSRLHSSSYMAELLVRSVMNANTNLHCIAECHDSGPVLSSSTSKLNTDLGEGTSHQGIEPQKSTHDCDPVGGLINKTVSEPYLLLPDTSVVTHSSNASSSSSLSSSDEDASEGLSDVKEDDKLELDTVSLIVKNVQEEEQEQKEQSKQLHFNYLDSPECGKKYDESKMKALFRSHILNSSEVPASAPVLPSAKNNIFLFSADVDKKIKELASSAIFDDTSTKPMHTKKGVMVRGLSKSCENIPSDDINDSEENSGFIKTAKHLFEKIAPISPVESHKMKSKCYSEELRSCSKSNPDVSTLGLVKTAIRTMLMDKVILITSQNAPVSQRAKDELQFSSQSNPDLRNHSLVKTAIQTILMEKINLMTSQRPPLPRRIRDELRTNLNKSSSRSHPDLQRDNVLKCAMETIHKVHLPRLHKKSTSSSLHQEVKIKESTKSISKSDPDLRYFSSVKSILFDKIPFLASGSSHMSYSHTGKFNTQHSTKWSKSDSEIQHDSIINSTENKQKTLTLNASETECDIKQQSLIKTAMETILIDKVNILTPNSPPVVHNNDKSEFQYPETKKAQKYEQIFDNLDESSLIKTAMQTMLIDRVNILSSNSPPVLCSGDKSEFQYPETKKNQEHEQVSENLENSTLIKTAMQTMLIDKVNILAPNSPHVSPNTEEHNMNESKRSNKHNQFGDVEDQSLVKTAMQTVLLDKVQILTTKSLPVSPTTEHEFKYDDSKSSKRVGNKNVIKTAVQSVLDKVHLRRSKSESNKKIELQLEANIRTGDNNSEVQAPLASHEEEFGFSNKTQTTEASSVHDTDITDIKNDNLVKTAMQTVLMEKVNIVAAKPIPLSKKESDETQTHTKTEKEKHHSFFCSLKKKYRSVKMKSPKVSFSRFSNKNKSDKQKDKPEGLVESAMSTILMDRVNNIKGLISSSSASEKEKMESENKIQNSCSEPKPAHSPDSDSSIINLETNSKMHLDSTPVASTYATEPNVNLGLDKGNVCNSETTAITAVDANLNTNAEHASCLYPSDRRIVESPVPEKELSSKERHGHQRTESTGGKMSQSPARLNAIPCIHRRSSDSDLSITPKGNSLTGSDRSGGAIPGYHHIRSTLMRPTVDNFDMMEYPFLTMSKYPPGFILHLGGAVSARSVKLLERITNIEEPETRDTWWSELRMEIRTHARSLNCNAVLGYTETSSICDEVCVLSASGTAAVIALYSEELSDAVSGLPNLHKPHVTNKDLMTSSLDRTDFERDKNPKLPDPTNANNKITQVTESPEQEAPTEFSGTTGAQPQFTACRICHIPYSESSMSFRINMLYCSLCKLAKVPDILLATIEIPDGLPITGRGCFLQSYVCRPKRDLKGELNAKEISESLPFLEYELHRLLVNKMKVKAMNTIFGLKVRITIGEKMLVGIATGTAVFLLPLPPPPLPKLVAGNSTTEDKKISEMQKLLMDTVKKNKDIYELKDQEIIQPIRILSDTEESDDEKSTLDLGAGNKDSCILEVDDSEDIEVINLLVEPRPPDGFHVVNTENVPGLEELEIVRNLQMFTQVWRAKIPLNQSASHFGKYFQKLLQSVYFKLRRMIPCALCDLQFRVDLPEPDEIQLTLLGMALGLGEPMKLTKYKRKNLCHLSSKDYNKKSDDELIFSLEEDHIPENSVPVISQGGLLNTQIPKHRQKSPQRFRMNTKQRHTPVKERHGVDITPLSYVPGGKIERYLGYLNFFFIRETTSIREGGGLSGFVHSFITEVLAIVRAHVTALGGNAMVAYFMTECVLYHNAHKNQGQCLINVGGDVVFVSYFTEDA